VIDPDWSLVDLDPRTWRALGPLFDPGQYIRAAQPGEHGLFVLHAGGCVLRVVDSALGVRRDLTALRVDDPRALAEALYAGGEWQRVHVIDQQHLAAVAHAAQATSRRDLTFDQYYHLVFHLLWGTPDGYVSIPAPPGHWHGWTYDGVAAAVGRLPDPATLALVVLDEPPEQERVAIGLILDLAGGRVRTVTTLETFGLPPPTLDLSAASFDRLWELLETRSRETGAPPPTGALLCDYRAFQIWLGGPDSVRPLTRLAAHGAAFWKLHLRPGR
jgi:hypothetical protein